MASKRTNTRKFTQAVGLSTWDELVKIAKSKDILVQELIRSHILPDWLEQYRKKEEEE